MIITSAKAGRQVMNNEAFEMPFWFREGSKPLLGDGLVSAEGAAHKVSFPKHSIMIIADFLSRSSGRLLRQLSAQHKFGHLFPLSGMSVSI